jgi:hypothetical protein
MFHYPVALCGCDITSRLYLLFSASVNFHTFFSLFLLTLHASAKLAIISVQVVCLKNLLFCLSIVIASGCLYVFSLWFC